MDCGQISMRGTLNKLAAMPIFSRKAKYHFIHIPKNGGLSIRAALKNRSYVSMSDPFHYRYVDIAGKVGEDRRCFCIVRNPWSRTASRYLYARQRAPRWPEQDPRRIYISDASFADFVRDQPVFPVPGHPDQPWMGPMNSWFDQLEWVRDANGIVRCDCLRFEFLSSDLTDYLQSPIDLPHENATRDSYDYREMYSDELTEIVAETFREDIAYFGFTFDGAAERRIVTLE